MPILPGGQPGGGKPGWNFQVPPEPLVRMPEVQPPPCLASGHITFGSLNNFVKLSPVTQEVLAFFGERGVQPDRVHIVGYQDGPDYIRTYHTMDIALDPFPFAGGITTFDPSFTGGVRVGVADYNSDGTLDILAASGVGARGTMNVFNYETLDLIDALFISDST